ncbi:MAG TPA: hemerythrin domain-containing protein [Rhodocyclaceae bacterium]|nr:hemerythrin domain-containing protein [Rhodocyclaceae bacterium]
MISLTQPLHDHHKHCDDLFADAEEAAHNRRWPECLQAFQRFRGELEAHFATEEQMLFPAFEAASGIVAGPSQVMRFEHAQMRDLLGQMEQAVAGQDARSFSGSAETLLVLMQQHNMKEENILYPMCERTLSGQGLSVGEGLQQRVEAACPV